MIWPKSRKEFRPRIPDGERVYAVGDIHGEASLFQNLLRKIAEDNEQRTRCRTTIVLLGDIIDRGPDTAILLAGLMGLSSPRFVILKGNHEAGMVECYRGEEPLAGWLDFGGFATLDSFGIKSSEIFKSDASEALRTIRKNISVDIIEWLENLPMYFAMGDYFFVHAGIRPGIRLDMQSPDDLLWIRKAFLSSRMNHEKVIVHGHTIERAMPSLGGNRIGLDTGAHEHGVLTAVGLEDDKQWIIQQDRATYPEYGYGRLGCSKICNVHELGA